MKSQSLKSPRSDHYYWFLMNPSRTMPCMHQLVYPYICLVLYRRKHIAHPVVQPLFKKIFLIEVQFIYNVSGVQQSDSVIHGHTRAHVCIHILFQILFHYSLSQDIDYSSLCYTVGHYQLSILYIVVCICQSQSPKLHSVLLIEPYIVIVLDLVAFMLLKLTHVW